MNTDDQNWSNGNIHSSARDRNVPLRRSSRSRSPGAREGERGLVRISGFRSYSVIPMFLIVLTLETIFMSPDSAIESIPVTLKLHLQRLVG